ncbi:hypothetical protein BH09MYX1_BH09MYX1_18470 [soil metagenome]
MRAAVFLLLGSAFVAALASCAASGVKHAPVLDSLTAPTDVALDTAKNKYPLVLTVVFHDEDDDAKSIRIDLQGYPSQTIVFGDTSLTQTLTVELGAGFKGQTVSYTVQVIDAQSLASNPELRTVKLL